MGIPITVGLHGTIFREAEISAQIPITVGIAGTLQHFTVSANLLISLNVGGALNFETDGHLHVNLPVPQINFEGLMEDVGALTLQLPMLTVTLSSYTSVDGDLHISIPFLSLDLYGYQEEEGSLKITLPMVRFKGIGYPSVDGELKVTLPMLIFEGSTIFGQVGHIHLTIPMQRIAFKALGSIEGDLVITIPMLFITFEESLSIYSSMVMNMANKALTIFTNYKFNSLCAFGGKHFGATAAGIFDLDTGTTDNGVIIDWNLKTGYLDLEQRKKKKLIQSWLSYKTDGDVKVTVIQPNGESYEYILTGIDDTETGLRLKFGKGIRTKYLALNMESIDGSTLDLDEWKLHFADSTFVKVR